MYQHVLNDLYYNVPFGVGTGNLIVGVVYKSYS